MLRRVATVAAGLVLAVGGVLVIQQAEAGPAPARGPGVSVSVATMMTSTDVYNSGYLVRWEDLSWPEKPF